MHNSAAESSQIDLARSLAHPARLHTHTRMHAQETGITDVTRCALARHLARISFYRGKTRGRRWRAQILARRAGFRHFMQIGEERERERKDISIIHACGERDRLEIVRITSFDDINIYCVCEWLCESRDWEYGWCRITRAAREQDDISVLILSRSCKFLKISLFS